MHSVFSSIVTAFSYAPRYRNRPRPLQSRKAGPSPFVWGLLVLSLWLGGSASAAQLTIRWDDNSSSEVGFKVERSTNGSTFTTIAVIGANQTSYIDSSVFSSTKYWYRVKAYDQLRSSSYSNVTSATTPAATTAPTSPSGGTTTAPTTGRIKALTVRALTEYNDPQSLIMKFTVAGATKSILLRGVGPGLDPYTDSKFLPDPVLKLYSGSTLLASNDNWGGSATLISLFNQVGAYAIPGYSKDAAIPKTLGVGSFTSVVNGAYSGLAQTEIYDADTATTPAGRLSKVSVRATVKTGSAALVSGFVVAGGSAVKLLIRAIGPSQTDITSGILVDPLLTIHKGTTLLGTNDNWAGNSTLAAAFTQVGASSLASSSKDSALLVTLSPGTYSATVTGVASTSGIARLEVYVVP